MFVNTTFWSRNGHFKALMLNALLVEQVRASDTPVQGHTATRVIMKSGKEYQLPFDFATTQATILTAAGNKPGKVVDLLLPPEPVEVEDATEGGVPLTATGVTL